MRGNREPLPTAAPDVLRTVLESLESLEQLRGELEPSLALLAGQRVVLDATELHGARRRALLLLAAGGDPEQGLALDGRAVTALADELDAPERRAALRSGLEALQAPAAGLDATHAALERLLANDELAWRALACALLAEALGGD